MDDRFNTIAGWVLFAGIVALGSSIVAGEVFHGERPERMGYPIEGVEIEGEGEAAELPIACFAAAADPAAGEQVFKKCAACHNADPGGANALGPALYGVMGNPVAGTAGFSFSDALAAHGGTWDWQTMSDWLASPKAFAPGTKMTFAGLADPQDRANLIAFLNTRDGSPVPPPAAAPEICNPDAAAAAAPAEGEAAAGAEAAAEGNVADTNVVEPVNIAPDETGTSVEPEGAQ